MTLAQLQCPKLLAVLDRFYAAGPRQTVREAEMLRPEEVPAPYRTLLVHANDMTSTLQRHHGEPMDLEVLERELAGGTLARHITLVGRRTRRPAEYGAIRIELDRLGENPRRRVLDGREPLGAILNDCSVAYQSCPGGFFRVRANELMCRVLRLDRPAWLFGRCNCLTDARGATLAEVVEILPPEGQPDGGINGVGMANDEWRMAKE